ncbi:hypothetical protein PTTG_09757 [Puccinia triticina 1-1 BBBD Race 1]|uniref:DUF6818 domain-containing protein n=1 Tax=Puccinia triticina (isolate 1-1 / race 1 (BBBD)) TaxID=630390 RepID=A0A180H0Y1_PUCT1|nr:hypothetical protein PTTG_09757 [Puccinia triticina 1-1 BBBD Race 1]
MTQIRSSQQTQQATQTTRQTQEATEPNQVPATTQATNTTTARRTGRQRGSQGYNGDDCTALVDSVKRVLPLGSNDWDRVHELYEQYAIENGRVSRDPDPLKTKFKALVGSKKPTGDPDCPVWIREAKQANVMIKERAHSLAFVDDDNDSEVEGGDARNGIGNPVPLSPGDTRLGSNTDRANESQGTLLSGWSASQSQLPANPTDNDGDSDEALQEISNVLQSSAQISTQANPAASTLATPIRPGHTVTQNQPLAQQSRAQSATPASHSTNTAPPSGPARRARGPQPQAGLQVALTSFFDPEARETHANSTISRLQAEANRLREGVNIQVLRLQDELQQVRKELAEKTADNQDLRHRMELMQMQMEFQQPGGYMQPPSMMRGGMAHHAHLYPQSSTLWDSPLSRTSTSGQTSTSWEIPSGRSPHTQ